MRLRTVMIYFILDLSLDKLVLKEEILCKWYPQIYRIFTYFDVCIFYIKDKVLYDELSYMYNNLTWKYVKFEAIDCML